MGLIGIRRLIEKGKVEEDLFRPLVPELMDLLKQSSYPQLRFEALSIVSCFESQLLKAITNLGLIPAVV